MTTEDFSSTSPDSEISSQSVNTAHKGLLLNPEHLKKEIERQHILCPNAVYAQMLLESAHLASFLTKKANNLMGMRYPYKRKTSAVGLYLPDENRIVIGDQKSLLKYRNKNNYAVYANWKDCVADYKKWQEENFCLEDRYLEFLGRTYAEDQHYAEKIKSISAE